MYVLVFYQWRVSFVFQMCVWKALVTGWWPGVCLVQLYLPRAIQSNQRDHAGLVCAYQKQPKMCMKWGQESCLKNVNNKRPFSTCFRSLNTYSPKGIPTVQLVLSGGPVTPTPIGEYNGLRGENRGPFKGQQDSASNPVIVRRAGLLWSQRDLEWRWSVPLFKCLTVLEFSFILFDLCLLITFFNFILNYVPIVTFWIFTYHKIWILSIMFCSIWSYWIIYFLACLEVSWRVVS